MVSANRIEPVKFDSVPQPRSQDGLQAEIAQRFETARASGGLTPAKIDNVTDSFVFGPHNGVPLDQLPPEIAQKILESRGKAMQEFLDSWAESIRKNAKADKDAAKRAFKLKFLERSQARVTRVVQRWLEQHDPDSPRQEKIRDPEPSRQRDATLLTQGGRAPGVLGAFNSSEGQSMGVLSSRKLV